MTTFITSPVRLQQLLNDIQTGNIQLPDFQRSWVWNDERICKLLTSVSSSHPIGSLMMLETGNPDVEFYSRPLKGIKFSNEQPKATQLILDGQQRLTSLFLTLLSEQVVETKDEQDKDVKRWYYIDIEKAIDPNIEREDEDVLISVPENKKKTSNFGKNIILDLSTSELEYKNKMFPLNKIFKHYEWERKYYKFWKDDEKTFKEFDEFNSKIIEIIKAYQIPIITLTKYTPKEAICQVFENVNTGGVPLTVFELLTATFASGEFQLREDWKKREKELKKHSVLENTKNTDFLQAVTLVKTYHLVKIEQKPSSISCKRKDILKLNRSDYEDYADKVMECFEKAAKLLKNEKIFYSRDLPYQTQPIALAAIYAILGDLADNDDIKAKLLRWYWCGVFGKMYGSGTETRLAKDVPQVINWINGGNEPDTIQEANFVASQIEELCTRNSAAYKGLLALISQYGCLDYVKNSTVEQSIIDGASMEIHHIFPQKWAKGKGLLPKQYDCIVNKTHLTKPTNTKVGGHAPSKHINILQASYIVSEEEMDERLRTHLIEPSVFRTDDFETFFDKRKFALLGLIEKAMGKPVVYPSSQS
ncbi:DUF262 domain-containing protein [Chroococcus sp. FPU101]|uniref:GmrSD restriction endonuclease domain-containing protein n=1 Tax=Chroococcus sp. FPU101 TaxID=1974212 RepID=UPI001A8FDFF4|nr:DUF262 domain-containing protein [Chroococcus sp. FPU101]GFE71478.1 hypothetical protein CFPU101_40880 [Chroococcus sp. FPU101]